MRLCACVSLSEPSQLTFESSIDTMDHPKFTSRRMNPLIHKKGNLNPYNLQTPTILTGFVEGPHMAISDN